ncbi:3-oxoacyl-ACP synthase [Rathayibacter sp. AY1G1]|jgi:3-oxoacyl-[acyl-carrier-protein] synthase-3|uniref:beta-ketoacyl-ACP synthase III n=1 Tax=unclassified Rathayibacter TaxID=2609250 RepID=UPI000CE90BBC|nr:MULTISPECIES: beta-ketoacyl-ACP synthase III [unclassified Rathayibacter]PPF10135.1 3-oxoacyl-ACP synthase [Rathayibacter sp. AY1A5]PPF16727.1 3-oxoacyl-ACP synthase [Rathayibacter sp. AY1A4]PPF22640.1 3-oxoacyl-ACP synthase [Rathayibacter sp. AY1A7]PPF26505.1 3-oxoacyl-ACP synthase [Rathayibacter sp. AY1F2]PPF34471.1 3-oxoacyl-ACP synthase [Rathayibacter sp. AY1A2]
MTTPSLTQSSGSAYTRILGIGAARGDLVVPNDDLIEPINSSDEWIRQRTGIIERRRASADIHAVDLATTASLEAIEKAGIRPDQIGVVLVSTISNTVQTPSLAALLADRIGANPAPAYDISAACAGYTYGIAQADSFIRSGLAEYVLVVGAEKLSELVKSTDRSISFLLGDGAGAAVVGPSDTAGISKTVWGSDGSKWDTVGMDNPLAAYRDGTAEWPTLRQDGPSVFRWAVWEMAKVAKQALAEAGVQPEDLAAFIPHQANMRIIDELAKQLKLPETVAIGRDIETTGNTSAASIPLATHRLLEEHPELHGGLALQIGFGAGLVFGAQVVVLP